MTQCGEEGRKERTGREGKRTGRTVFFLIWAFCIKPSERTISCLVALSLRLVPRWHGISMTMDVDGAWWHFVSVGESCVVM